MPRRIIKRRKPKKGKKSAARVSYKAIQTMVKSECMKEAETKVLSDGVDYPTLIDYDDPSYTQDMADGGYRLHEITPLIEQSGDDLKATRFRRQGDKVRLLRLVTRLNYVFHSSDEPYEAFKDYDWRVLLLRVKREALIDGHTINECLKPERKGSLQIDVRDNAQYDHRNLFNVLERVSIKPKWMKIMSKSTQVTNNNLQEVPTYTVSDDCTVYGLMGQVALHHDFKGAQTIFENEENNPKNYKYYLMFQNGWFTVGGNTDPGTQQFPRIRIWNTYYFKDA